LFIPDQLAYFYNVYSERPVCGRSQCEKSAISAYFPGKTAAEAA